MHVDTATERKELLKAELLCHLRTAQSLLAKLEYQAKAAQTLHNHGITVGKATGELVDKIDDLYSAIA